MPKPKPKPVRANPLSAYMMQHPNSHNSSAKPACLFHSPLFYSFNYGLQGVSVFVCVYVCVFVCVCVCVYMCIVFVGVCVCMVCVFVCSVGVFVCVCYFDFVCFWNDECFFYVFVCIV